MKDNKRKRFYTCYRIVNDNFSGYEVQVKRWWFPFWVEKHKHGWTNTFSSIESAKDWIKKGCTKNKGKRIEYWRECN